MRVARDPLQRRRGRFTTGDRPSLPARTHGLADSPCVAGDDGSFDRRSQMAGHFGRYPVNASRNPSAPGRGVHRGSRRKKGPPKWAMNESVSGPAARSTISRIVEPFHNTNADICDASTRHQYLISPENIRTRMRKNRPASFSRFPAQPFQPRGNIENSR
jgi:hypothetical protein